MKEISKYSKSDGIFATTFLSDFKNWTTKEVIKMQQKSLINNHLPLIEKPAPPADTDAESISTFLNNKLSPASK